MSVDTTDAVSTEELHPNATISEQDSPTASASIDEAFKSILGPIEDRIATLAARLEGRPDVQPATNDGSPTLEAMTELQTQQSFMFNALDDLSSKVDRLLESATAEQESEPPQLIVAEVKEEVTPADTSDQWGGVIFGKELNSNESVAGPRRQLLDDALSGDENAVGLAARVMLVQTATPADLPSLLKELGEAFYRWRPNTTDSVDKMEEALVAWLHDRIAAAGLRNRIDVVRVRDQYDSTRHMSSQRGIEVSEVSGWVVLRDNGRPLSKAKVSLKQG